MAVYSFKSVESVTLASPAASITFSGLSGTQFEVDGYIVNDANNKDIHVRLNGDTSATYSVQDIAANATAVAGLLVTGATSFDLTQGTTLFGNEKGSFSLFIAKPAAAVKGQIVGSVGENGSVTLDLLGGEWNNTSALVTSITLSASSNNFAASTQISLFSNAGTGGAQWERITTVVLASAAASISVTGIDTDYRKFKALLYAVKDGTAGAVIMRLNADSGNNYIAQRINADSTTVGGSRTSAESGLFIGAGASIAANATGLVAITVQKPVAATPGRISTAVAPVVSSGIKYSADECEWNNTADLISATSFTASSANLAANTRLLLSGATVA